MNWFPILLVTHILLAISLLAPSLLLPFLLRRADAAGVSEYGPVTRGLLVMQGTGSVVIAIGLALTGIGLLITLSLNVLDTPWLLVALTIYALNLLVAIFISRPNLRRLLRMQSGDPAAWERRARRQRYVAYGMAAATGVIGFLMMSKPGS
ncbi:MAG TPA: hypothetical protein VFY43_00705 [Candidatus Limnocylindria bacterium]|nr:hypothetical protein [Candidatus Limnocylindria bacterium]